MTNLDLNHWDPLGIDEAQQLFEEIRVPYWIAGGQAIDLFVGYTIRPHTDLDVQILRRDQLIFQEALSAWDLYKTGSGGLQPWEEGEFLKLGSNQIWCRQDPAGAWKMEIMLLDADQERWWLRRNPQIGGSLESFGRVTPEGIPYIAPEIQLLFKAHNPPRPKDDIDLAAALPRLEPEQLSWLIAMLPLRFPEGHPWIDRLNAGE